MSAKLLSPPAFYFVSGKSIRKVSLGLKSSLVAFLRDKLMCLVNCDIAIRNVVTNYNVLVLTSFCMNLDLLIIILLVVIT